MSTLEPEEEQLLAAAVIQFVSSLLDALPASYAIEVNTSDDRSYRCVRSVSPATNLAFDRIDLDLLDARTILN